MERNWKTPKFDSFNFNESPSPVELNKSPPCIKIEEASPISIACNQDNFCTPIPCVDRKVRHKSNILGGDEENRARWIDINMKFSYLKNSFDNLYSGLFLSLSGVRPPNQPWTIRPEPQRCTYQDGFREYPSEILDLFLNSWHELLDDEDDVGQDFTLVGAEECDIQMENVDGELNMGQYLEYDDDQDKEHGEVNLSIQILESKCMAEIKSDGDAESVDSDEQVC